MNNKTQREQLEAYVKQKYNVEPEQLPFNHEDYAIFRHPDSGKWFAVFIVKSCREFGLAGEGDAEIVSLKVHDPSLADLLMQRPGFLRGYPSINWNWISIVLDGTIPFEEVCTWMDESYQTTISKAKNKIIPLPKRGTKLTDSAEGA